MPADGTSENVHFKTKNMPELTAQTLKPKCRILLNQIVEINGKASHPH